MNVFIGKPITDFTFNNCSKIDTDLIIETSSNLYDLYVYRKVLKIVEKKSFTWYNHDIEIKDTYYLVESIISGNKYYFIVPYTVCYSLGPNYSPKILSLE
jgi:hypothetical protein